MHKSSNTVISDHMVRLYLSAASGESSPVELAASGSPQLSSNSSELRSIVLSAT